MIPDPIQIEIEKQLGDEIKSANSVSGGSINQAAKVEMRGGRDFFLKWNKAAPDDMFPKEKKGLELLKSAGAGLHIPNVLAVGKAEGTAFILIEFIEEQRGGKDSSAKFGKQLAELHQVTAHNYGLEYDNYIGRLKQPNNKKADWVDFFIEYRLEVQLKQAVDAGKLENGTVKQFNRLYKKLPDMLPEEPASLLHGDLWGGNYFFDQEGRAAIFDPAVYYGNREIEIAFTYLFGGFSGAFYDAYQEVFPLQPKFNERKSIYNLYPLLVHTNMFGGHYGRQVEQTAARYS
ncbi:MAG TPA: fructosamine kinase family protein [Balneolaceae bacterium]|nr:fructosamine kinase family protein [Balneolaceae bacterium]